MDGHMGNNPRATWTLDVAKAVTEAVEPYDLFFSKSRSITPIRGATPNSVAQRACRSPAESASRRRTSGGSSREGLL